MNNSTAKTSIILLCLGLLLALAKIIYLFFDFYNILDLVVFFGAGFTLSRKVTTKRLTAGVLLFLPAFALSLFFVIRLGYSSISQGIGTSFAVSLVVIPLATFIGITIGAKRANHKSV